MNKKAEFDRKLKQAEQFAAEQIAKNQVMQFRIDDANFQRLLKAAKKQRMHVGAMLRAWVLERLVVEEGTGPSAPQELASALHMVLVRLDKLDQVSEKEDKILKAISKLEKHK